MKGFITAEINERQYPGVDSQILGYYRSGQSVEVVSLVEGDEIDGESLWYKLDNGAYLWSGGVNVERDCSGLPLEDRRQFLLCYRQAEGTQPKLDTFIPANRLYVANTTLPSTINGIMLQEQDPGTFTRSVINSLQNLPESRKHVMVYIHGYQLISSLKMDLFQGFVQSYLSHKDNSIAKVIFFTWPAQGGPARKTVDDRSIRAGQNFTKLGLFKYFEELSHELKKKGKSLNLVVHSFGHQLLNGMLNLPAGETAALAPEVFENVILMAPDVTHLALTKKGIVLKNYYKDDEGTDFNYHYKSLLVLAKKVHVFYDADDFLLYVSTKKFVEKGLTSSRDPGEIINVKQYRSLGNYGMSEIEENELEPGFNYYNIQDLFKNSPSADLYDFPYQPIKRKLEKFIKAIREESNYDSVNPFRILFNSGRFTNHHRYLFTCKPVVDKVLEILS